MMLKKADRLVCGGDPQKSWATTTEVPLQVTTLPSLTEIHEEIKRQAPAETAR